MDFLSAFQWLLCRWNYFSLLSILKKHWTLRTERSSSENLLSIFWVSDYVMPSSVISRQYNSLKCQLYFFLSMVYIRDGPPLLNNFHYVHIHVKWNAGKGLTLFISALLQNIQTIIMCSYLDAWQFFCEVASVLMAT